jgi:hypothetical protein
MTERKQIKLEEVEWDGLLLDIVMVLNRIFPMEKLLNSVWYQKLSAFVTRYNPCHSDENSWAWKVMCYLFPDCWCCSGIRGFIYGVIFMVIVWGIFV